MSERKRKNFTSQFKTKVALDTEAQAALLERAKQIVAETKLPAKTWVKGIVSTL